MTDDGHCRGKMEATSSALLISMDRSAAADLALEDGQRPGPPRPHFSLSHCVS